MSARTGVIARVIAATLREKRNESEHEACVRDTFASGRDATRPF